MAEEKDVLVTVDKVATLFRVGQAATTLRPEEMATPVRASQAAIGDDGGPGGHAGEAG